MSANRPRSLVIGAALAALVSLPVAAEAQQGPPAGTPTPIGPQPTHLFPPPSPTAGPTLPAVEATPIKPTRPNLAPNTSVLQEISRRQVELSLMELDLKKAELTQKLAEARGQTVQADMLNAGPVQPPFPQGAPLPPPMLSPDPEVRLIHKQGGTLVANLEISPTVRITVRAGDRLPDGLRVVDVRPDLVLVQRAQGGVYALGMSTALRGSGF